MSRWFHRVPWLGAGLWLACAARASSAAACPMCKEALLSGGGASAQRVALGYLLGVAALVGTPVVLVSAIAWRVVHAVRRAQARGHQVG